MPLSLVLDIFARLPADERARCALVCRGWRATVAHASLWRRLDLSPSSGVSVAVTDTVLFAAAALARGGLASLDVFDCDSVTHEARLAVARANVGTLKRLRLSSSWQFDDTSSDLEALLAAVPLLTRCEADVHCWAQLAVRMLRNEPPFEALRLRRVEAAFDSDSLAEQLPTLHELLAALPAHPSLTTLELWGLPLTAPAALDAVVDVAVAQRLERLGFVGCALCPASTPSLARLLRSGALGLNVAGGDVALLDAPAAALLADALRDSACALMSLSFRHVRLWHDMDAAAALLAAATAHPRLAVFGCHKNAVQEGHAGAVGVLLAAVVAANAPALTELDVGDCELGDAGMAPIVSALTGNTHLRKLTCFGNDMSEAFARGVLLPAVRASTGLRSLVTFQEDVMAMREAEALVAARALAAGGAQ